MINKKRRMRRILLFLFIIKWLYLIFLRYMNVGNHFSMYFLPLLMTIPLVAFVACLPLMS